MVGKGGRTLTIMNLYVCSALKGFTFVSVYSIRSWGSSVSIVPD
jgi:hypothetical protein